MSDQFYHWSLITFIIGSTAGERLISYLSPFPEGRGKGGIGARHNFVDIKKMDFSPTSPSLRQYRRHMRAESRTPEPLEGSRGS
jgi:hypothetical protein